MISLGFSSLVFSGCDVLSQLPGATGNGVTETEAGEGIKEALGQGLVKAVLQLNKEDGFFKDAFYKILMPPDAKKIENTLRDLGMGKMVDRAILQINRAAEDAAGYAKPIFVDANEAPRGKLSGYLRTVSTVLNIPFHIRLPYLDFPHIS